MPAYIWRWMVLLSVRFSNALGDAEPLGIAPADLPEPLRGAPYGAEALRALAQFGFLKGDAHGDDFIVAAAQAPRARTPGHGLDDQLHGLAVALEELLGAALAGAQRQPGFHGLRTGGAAVRLTAGKIGSFPLYKKCSLPTCSRSPIPRCGTPSGARTSARRSMSS